jgi:urease accessory protein
MWCERVLYNLHRSRPRGVERKTIDYVDLAWNECDRLLKRCTRGGQPIRVLLSEGQRLRDGDVLWEDESNLVAVNVLPAEVIIAGPARALEMTLLALELGNLHWPTQIAGDQIIFPEHATAIRVLEKLRIPWSRELRRFEPADVMAMPSLRVSQNIQTLRGQGPAVVEPARSSASNS